MDNRKLLANVGIAPPSPLVSPVVGFAQDGSPIGPVLATSIGAYAWYSLTEEIRNVIEAAGLTPDYEDLTQLVTAVQHFANILPLAALPYPTVATSDNRLGATVSSEVGTGGKVSVPAGVAIALAEEFSLGVSGRERVVTTAAWTSASLATASTYYLRALISAGVFTPYVQKGTDGDATPGGLMGTPNGASGGGFGSTVLDVLLAKVVTGIAGSNPTLTQLANSRWLRAQTELELVVSSVSSWTALGSALTLNWARTPVISTIALSGLRTNNSAFPAAISDYGAAGDFGSVAVRLTGVSRYTATPEYSYDDSTGTAGRVQYVTLLEA